MPSLTLTRILSAARPFVPFSYTLHGEDIAMFAKKTSAADNETLTAVWQASYATRLAEDEYEDNSVIYAQLRRYDASQLAKYIAQADKRDLAQQASAELNDAPITDEEVIARTNELVKEREAHIVSAVPETEMLNLAIKRRAHFDASSKASTATNRLQFRLTVFDENKEPLIANEADLDQLPLEDFLGIFTAALSALSPPEEAAPNPLF